MKNFIFKAEIADHPLGKRLELRASWEREYPLPDKELALDRILDQRAYDPAQRAEIAVALHLFADALERA